GRRGGVRRAPRPPRRRPRVVGLVVVLLVVATVVGVVDGTQSGALSLFGADEGERTQAEPAARRAPITGVPDLPQPVVPAVRFNQRILTLPEMKKKFGKQDLHLVDADPTRPTTFTISSFNVLGSTHTSKKGAAAGPARAARAGALVRRKGVSVVGLQEFQSNQVGPFVSNAGGFEVYPGTSQGSLNGENSIAWDPDVWDLVESHTVGIPYFFGKPRQMPYVLLRNVDTNRLAWFTNYHNPADVFGCKCGGHRVAATNREIALAKELTAGGTPMFTTGDMNDRDSYACRYATAGLHSADGVTRAGGACHLPGDEWIDWIWGSSQVTFADYDRDYSTRNGPRISDHPVITATATIAPAAEDCKSYTRHGTKYWFCPDPTA
ncbi:hypothetical protein ACH5WX_10960, partial [Nocardioides sp. CER28]